MSWKLALGLLGVAVALAVGSVKADDATGTDDDGFIRAWLVAGPIPLTDGVEPVDAVDKEQIKDEAKLDPKAGEKAKAGEKEVEWKKVSAGEFFVDLNDALGQNEKSVAYLVVRVTSPDDRKVTLKVGSDDQCKVYLNGKDVLKSADDRSVDKDQSTAADLDLKKGANVLVVKVINNGGEWKACARFTDADGNPVKGLKAEAAK